MDAAPVEPAAPGPCPAPPPEPPKKKALFETVLGATPIIMTIVATFMVGQSSAEMTRAQYHRATAGQNQSKVGDQWAFFQAKRIRGTSYEVSADLLSTLRDPAPVTQEGLVEAVDAVVAAAKKAAAAQKPGTPGTLTPLVGHLEETSKKLQELLDGKNQDQTKFSAEHVQYALDALVGKSLAPSKKSTETSSKIDANQADVLKHLVAGIKSRLHETVLAPMVLQLTDDTMHKAITEADTKANTVSQEGKRAENVLEEIDKLVGRFLGTSRKILQVGRRSAGAAKENADLAEMKAAVEGLQVDYTTARHAFTAKRYERDARSNQDAAYLYEVKVFMSSARSDRHLYRSHLFFYAMLVAQVGVAISSVALAVRRKSLVWGLATAAGLIAVSFGASVFLGLAG